MNKNEKVESFKLFKERYEKECKEVNFEKFCLTFHAQDYLLSHKIMYLDEYFYETIFSIVAEGLKMCIHDLEYYVNVKPSSPITTSDYEIVKDNKEIIKLYFLMHKEFKKHSNHIFKDTYNSKEVIENIKGIYDLIQDYKKLVLEINEKLTDNIDKKLEESQEEKKAIYESSIFN